MSEVKFTLHTHIFDWCSFAWKGAPRGTRIWAVALGDRLEPAAFAGVALSFLEILPFLYCSAVSARASTRYETGRSAQKGTAFA